MQQTEVMDKRKFLEFAFGLPPNLLSKRVIISPVLPLKLLVNGCKKRAYFNGRLYSSIKAENSSYEFTVVQVKAGAHFTGDAILAMDSSPVEEVVFIGTCGGLRDSKIGDIVVCENAFNGEGFTRYHQKSFDLKKALDSEVLIPADETLVKDLRKFLLKKNHKEELIFGNIFTIGSFLAEEKENLLEIERKGFVGIDMELSAVYHAARVTGKKAMACLVVSDLPLSKPIWEKLTFFEKKDYNKKVECSINLVVDFIGRGGSHEKECTNCFSQGI